MAPKIWHSLEVGFKPNPVGLFNNGPVEICLDILVECPIDVGAIDSVVVRTYHDAWKFTGQKYTTTESNYVDAHLSMPYSLAVTLMDGAMTPRQLAKDRLRDPVVHELASRVKVVEVDEMTPMYPHEWPVEVEICLKDGEVRKRRIDQVKWAPRRPPLWDEAAEKFIAMGEPVIGVERAKEVIDFVATLDDAPSVAPLMKLVA